MLHQVVAFVFHTTSSSPLRDCITQLSAVYIRLSNTLPS